MPKLKDNIHTNRPNIKELTQEDGGTRLTELKRGILNLVLLDKQANNMYMLAFSFTGYSNHASAGAYHFMHCTIKHSIQTFS